MARSPMDTKTRFDQAHGRQGFRRISRRHFLGAATATALTTLTLPAATAAFIRRLPRPVRLGAIADLHQDIMHDGPARMRAFLERMRSDRPDALMQLGDFAYPAAKNREVIEAFNQTHEVALHVIGNHDTDAGHTKQECLEVWGMPSRYYARLVAGIRLLVLDGNDRGSPTYKGGYPAYIGPEQTSWLKEQLKASAEPVVVASHQPLAGSDAVDNAEELQTILGDAAEKVVLAINGHTHLDAVHRIRNVTYLHVNSASYYWVGSTHRHQSYSPAVHAAYPWIDRTCPYRDSLFATVTIDPATGTIQVQGRTSTWVGPSPAELGVTLEGKLLPGEEVAPRIRDRRLTIPPANPHPS